MINSKTTELQQGDLQGTLVEPITNTHKTVVLIIAGSGPTDRNGNQTAMHNNSLKLVAQMLEKNGIASLRYDKRGIGQSGPKNEHQSLLRFEHYVEDAKNWIQHLRGLTQFNKIIVLGHSEGALIGMICAQMPTVDSLISVAGSGRDLATLISEQLHKQIPALSGVVKSILTQIASGKIIENVPEVLRKIFHPSIQPYLASSFKYDPTQEIKTVNKPVLIIQGDTDIQVTVHDATLLHEACDSSQLQVISRMNHILKSSCMDRDENLRTYNNPDLPLHPEVESALVSFIEKQGTTEHI